ncbi:MAG: nucleotidyl transferase AbiEii/AbiGii toxin family protein [Rhodopirellula sp.]|nr:nucleotidyl transferase AbiEii/AbiGii toxin family protein [Rhodopirellula sp.]
MTEPANRNVAASVRQRLLNYSRETRQEFQHVLTRYGLERLLYRISLSPVRKSLILKGAMLFQVWSGELHRPTRDLDLLGFGEPSHDRFVEAFQDICRMEVEPDGLAFDGGSVRIEDIREDAEYHGIRVKMRAMLERARIELQVDIGFGDAITPDPVDTEYPTLLEFPAPIIRAYPRETVIAEKLQAMVMLGIANSRMKDFYDVWTLSRLFDFHGELLTEAISATFERRQTTVPAGVPFALTDDFATDSGKGTQWTAFVRKGGFDDCPAELRQIVEPLREFLLPPLSALSAETQFIRSWSAGGPWLK